MTVKALLDRADTIFPNVCPFALKSFWLYELDKQIYTDFLEPYGIFADPESEDSSCADRELLIADGFSGVYLYYVFMQLELMSGNITGYQNQAGLFNRAYMSFMNFFNRNHTIPSRKIIID